MQDIKLAFNPVNGEVLDCGQNSHAVTIGRGKAFDKYVRAIVFPDKKRVYFRFYTPSGDYFAPEQNDVDYAFLVCGQALDKFILKKIVKKSYKVLYWQTDTKIKPEDVTL
jgi:hypothetical protein